MDGSLICSSSSRSKRHPQLDSFGSRQPAKLILTALCSITRHWIFRHRPGKKDLKLRETHLAETMHSCSRPRATFRMPENRL
jgi:hypothetical protein